MVLKNCSINAQTPTEEDVAENNVPLLHKRTNRHMKCSKGDTKKSEELFIFNNFFAFTPKVK